MKRSEIIKIIAEVIYNSGWEEDCETIAFRVLAEVEKAGMLPPFAHLKNLGTSDTSWEPETEQE